LAHLTSAKYENDYVKTRTFWDTLILKIRRIPGVTEASLSDNPPLWDQATYSLLTVNGQPRPEPDHEPVLAPQTISSGYFRTMQIPVLQGRDFDSGDKHDKPNVVIVDAALAKSYFPDQNPIGCQENSRRTA
jgi:putative ABC transport system permease protein